MIHIVSMNDIKIYLYDEDISIDINNYINNIEVREIYVYSFLNEYENNVINFIESCINLDVLRIDVNLSRKINMNELYNLRMLMMCENCRDLVFNFGDLRSLINLEILQLPESYNGPLDNFDCLENLTELTIGREYEGSIDSLYNMSNLKILVVRSYNVSSYNKLPANLESLSLRELKDPIKNIPRSLKYLSVRYIDYESYNLMKLSNDISNRLPEECEVYFTCYIV